MTSISQNKPAPSPAAEHRVVFVLLLILQVIGALSLVLWLVSIFAIGMMADNISQLESKGPILPFLIPAVVCYPVLPIGMTILAWVLFRRRKGLAAVLITIVELILAAALFWAFLPPGS